MTINAEREKAGLPPINVPCMLELRNTNGTHKTPHPVKNTTNT